jgi:hypothetical protein
MNPEMLQVIGAYGGVLAVVVSILGLASQVRQNTQALRSQNYGKALDRLAAVQSRLGADSESAGVFNRGVNDAGSLTPDERSQFTWILYEIFGAFEFMHDESQRGTLPPQVWDRWAATLAWWISLPGVQAWWDNKPTPFNQHFSAHVDHCIRTPTFDADAARRWRRFLRGQASRAGHS